jgi:hypothetical protein
LGLSADAASGDGVSNNVIREYPRYSSGKSACPQGGSCAAFWRHIHVAEGFAVLGAGDLGRKLPTVFVAEGEPVPTVRLRKSGVFDHSQATRSS